MEAAGCGGREGVGDMFGGACSILQDDNVDNKFFLNTFFSVFQYHPRVTSTVF